MNDKTRETPHTVLPQQEADALPFPVLEIDRNGKIVWKNRFAYEIRLTKKNMNFEKLLLPASREQLKCVLAEGKTAVLRCIAEHGISHAVLFFSRDRAENDGAAGGAAGNAVGNATVFLVLTSAVVHEVFDAAYLESEKRIYHANECLILTYRKICEAKNLPEAAETAVLLQNCALRFFRIAHHFSRFVDVMRKTGESEDAVLCDLGRECLALTEYFAAKAAPLGYRLHIDAKPEKYVFMLRKRTFVSLYLELLSIALRVSENYHCSVCVSEADGCVRIWLACAAPALCIKETVETLFAAELKFVGLIAEDCGWLFSGLLQGDDRMMSLSLSIPLPAQQKPESNVFAPVPEVSEDDEMKSFRQIADEVLSTLYFASAAR